LLIFGLPFGDILNLYHQGKNSETGTVRREENSEGLGAIGIDFSREIWEGLGFYVWD